MVWFQCEDCGENLKKPKLPSHFNICFAHKLSCIDCGEVFTQQSSQHHTQCITETEKYGPKGQGHASNDTTKPKWEKKNHLNVDFDINVGLSDHPPWFCSFCNTKATSRTTLLLHAEGKKHMAKARALHASKQQPEAAARGCCPDESVVNGNTHIGVPMNSVGGDAQKPDGEEDRNPSRKRMKTSHCEQGVDGGDKLADGSVAISALVEPKVEKRENGTSVQVRMGAKTASDPGFIGQEPINRIKWKKLIASCLKSRSDGVMKLKKLRKLVLSELGGDSAAVNEEKMFEFIDEKIKSSSRFTVVGKRVHLVCPETDKSKAKER